MREPIVAHLRGEVEPGIPWVSLWLYRRQPDGCDALLVRIP
jgi:hypothetical protein